MTIKEWMKKNEKRLDEKDILNECMKAVNCTNNAARKVLSRDFRVHPKNVNTAGISEADLRAKHDVLFQLRKGIEKLQDGVYPIESEFVTDYCSISKGGYKHLLERPEFLEYHGRAGSTIYWSTKKSINKLKNDKVLS